MSQVHKFHEWRIAGRAFVSRRVASKGIGSADLTPAGIMALFAEDRSPAVATLVEGDPNFELALRWWVLGLKSRLLELGDEFAQLGEQIDLGHWSPGPQ